ncbi:hypothetical protein BD408DRAFT_416908 [Parasitella parasitica]|nr:hypothetical protein BD408DRAFT_416908 [Parasitella parasitica]
MYVSLATLLRDVNNTTDQRKLKIEMNRLFEVAPKEDENICRFGQLRITFSCRRDGIDCKYLGPYSFTYISLP